MKESFYNFVFDYPEDTSKHALYNSRTNALALVEKEQYEEFKKFKSNNAVELEKDFAEKLKYGGYVVDDDSAELDEIRLGMLTGRFGTDRLSLTIAPTSDCNFRCSYCYEKDNIKHPKMSIETQDSIIQYVEKKSSTIENLTVTWYGGEPLLAMDVIENLSDKFLDICKKNNVEYFSGIITNGYLLTKENAHSLTKCCVSHIQVTLDGASKQHDKRRPLTGGGPTFDVIINNLKNLKGVFNDKISLRINTDKTNIGDVQSVISVLKSEDLEQFVFPYLAKIEDTNGCCDESSCYNQSEFAGIDFHFRQYNNILNDGYPMLRRNFCGADSVSACVIDADGLIYKCWSDIGMHDRNVGNINEIDNEFNHKLLLEYMLFDPTKDNECSKCKYLPLCMGGCPIQRLQSNAVQCDRIKYSLDRFMGKIPNIIYNRLKHN